MHSDTTTIQNHSSKDFFKEFNYFIRQGCIQLIERDIEDIYKVTKDFSFK